MLSPGDLNWYWLICTVVCSGLVGNTVEQRDRREWFYVTWHNLKLVWPDSEGHGVSEKHYRKRSPGQIEGCHTGSSTCGYYGAGALSEVLPWILYGCRVTAFGHMRRWKWPVAQCVRTHSWVPSGWWNLERPLSLSLTHSFSNPKGIRMSLLRSAFLYVNECQGENDISLLIA